MAKISTHVLDTSTGEPASGIPVVLTRADLQIVGRGATDAQGRIDNLCLEGSPLETGAYELGFDTQAYFDAQGVSSLYPSVVVRFRVTSSAESYHLPLLLSPYGYSTYRGR